MVYERMKRKSYFWGRWYVLIIIKVSVRWFVLVENLVLVNVGW